MTARIGSELFRQQLALAASEGAMWGGLLDIADDYARTYAAEQLRAAAADLPATPCSENVALLRDRADNLDAT